MIRRPLFASLVAAFVIGVAGSVWLSAQAPRPHVVFVTGDDEYRSEITMPMIAKILEQRHGLRTSVAYARPTPIEKNPSPRASSAARGESWPGSKAKRKRSAPDASPWVAE